jgi:hypothetical protein
VGLRLIFVALSTAVMVFFSEKAFWYLAGYALPELIFFYAFPVYACFWAIDHFRVRRLPAVILIAALYAFLVEGVLTPVLFEAGLLDPIMPAYFVGWHGLLSLTFGWYVMRKWLIHGRRRRLLLASALFGVFWGIWSITYWLPESGAELAQAAAAESMAGAAVWPISQFALYAFVFSGVLMVSHWLLGQGGWRSSFRMSKGEKWVIGLSLILFFATLSAPAAPLGFLKLGVLLGVLYLPLARNRRREKGGSLFAALAGGVQLTHTWPLLATPLAATAVYAAASVSQLPEETIRLLLELIPPLQSVLGGVIFLWAVAATFFAKTGDAPGGLVTTPPSPRRRA